MVHGDPDGPARHSVGDRVFGQRLVPGSIGANADYVVAAADATVATVPEVVSSGVAATLPTPAVTAPQLARSLGPTAAKTVAVLGAGEFLIQLLVAFGARVRAVSS